MIWTRFVRIGNRSTTKVDEFNLEKTISIRYEIGWARKCNYFQVLVDHKVLVFDIAVGDTLTFQVIYSVNDLREYVASLVLGETFFLRLFDAFKQVM